MKRVLARLVGVMLVTATLAACDKCGERVKFNAPSAPQVCGDNANPG